MYYVAAVGIVYDPETHTQNFYRVSFLAYDLTCLCPCNSHGA